MKRTFAYGASTTQGSWPAQEDGYFADPSAGVFAIADGFGGRGAGDMAAKQAIAEIRNAPAGDRGPREGGTLTPSQAWQRELFGEINRKLLQWNEKKPPGARGGCSLLLATVEKDRQLTITSCGACSAFLWRAGSLLPLLPPQCPPRVSPGGPLFPSQAMGLGMALNPESRAFGWTPGDILFLFSSGIEWEREGFAAQLGAQLSLRAPGADLGAAVTLLTEGEGGLPPAWNQTALAVEALN